MSGTTQTSGMAPQTGQQDAPSRQASGLSSMGTGVAAAIVINQYLHWKNVQVDPDFPLAVFTLAAAGVHAMQVAGLALLDRISPRKP